MNSKDLPLFSKLDEKLFDSRIVLVHGPVNAELATSINRQLLALAQADRKAPIYLHINCPGGEINSGFSIYDTAQFVGPEIYTIVIGLAASMGSIISLCAKKENRLSLPNSKFLIHQPLISGHITGSASELEIHARDIIKTREKINRLYAKETGKSYEDVVKATDRDYWMSADEAREFGLVSRIISKHTEI